MSYDLVLAGGRVLDPGGAGDLLADVGVRGGRVAELSERLPREGARDVLDVRGRIVTPGLVDLHTHVFAGGSFWGIDPAPVAWRSGVTTWVDAGSAGAYTVRSLRTLTERSPVRVPALLNVAATGIVARTGECVLIDTCDIDLAIRTVEAHRDFVVGIKVRIDRETVGGHGLEPLRRARTVAESCRLPLMTHIALPPPSVPDVVALLRPGDILTHCASGVTEGMIDAGQPRPEVVDAYRRGVLFDLGHGFGSFSFDVLEAQLAAGLVPHTVSSDLHAQSLRGLAFDLPTVMAKVLAVGLDLPRVVEMATARPARALGLDGAGTLRPGLPADLAVFRLEDDDYVVADTSGGTRRAESRLVAEATFVGGRRLPPVPPEPPPPWIGNSSEEA